MITIGLIFALLTPSLQSSDTSALYQKYFGELKSLSLQILNPDLSEASRKPLMQQLKTEIEILNELTELSNLVRDDISLNALRHIQDQSQPVDILWKKLSLRILKTLGPDAIERLTLRLEHKDPVVRSMALMSLTEDLKQRPRTYSDSLQTAGQVLKADELAQILNALYERSSAVEPAFRAAKKHKNIDLDIAAEVSQQLRQTLVEN